MFYQVKDLVIEVQEFKTDFQEEMYDLTQEQKRNAEVNGKTNAELKNELGLTNEKLAKTEQLLFLT